MLSTEEMLEKRNEIILEWNEPWPATDKNGNETFADVKIRATVDACINIERFKCETKGYKIESESELLENFIAVNWAYVYNIEI